MTGERVYRFFSLRPSLSWSLLSGVLLWIGIITIAWGGGIVESAFQDIDDTPFVPVNLQPESTKPEMDLSDATADVPAAEKPLMFGSIDESFQNIRDAATAPRPRFSTLPGYPDSMRHEGIEGTVLIELGIDETGRVVYGKIARSLGKKFDAIVIEWARGISFYPARSLERRPFKCRIQLPVRFKLDS